MDSPCVLTDVVTQQASNRLNSMIIAEFDMLQMGLDAIINAGTRKERVQRRWFYWKYKEEVDELRRQAGDWMGDQNESGTIGGAGGGYAIGRRIYEKQASYFVVF